MCSTIIFDVDGAKCLAENYDYLLDHGLVGTNLRGTKKTNGHDDVNQVIDWVVKYGSISFNQFSLEMPVSGMNEAGLCIALMWHDEGNFGSDENFRRLNPLQWIQYLLDNCESIEEVIVSLQAIRPEQGPIPLHYMLLDASGDSLIVEFIDGELVLHKNVDYPILTNSNYEKCVASAEHAEGHEILTNSIGRFVHLYRQLSSQKGGDSAAGIGFGFLDAVSQTPGRGTAENFPWMTLENDTITAWSIVFNPSQKTILYKTDKNKAIRELNLRDMNFDASSEYQIADINAGSAGSMMPFFEPYSIDKNQEILSLAAPLVGLPDEAIKGLAEAVDSFYSQRKTIL